MQWRSLETLELRVKVSTWRERGKKHHFQREAGGSNERANVYGCKVGEKECVKEKDCVKFKWWNTSH